MTKLTQTLMISLLMTASIASVKAQSNAQLDEIRNLCTELTVISSQVGADAHKVIVFSNNGNRKQMDRSVRDTDQGLGEVEEGLRRLRRISNGIVTNQRGDEGAVYRSSSSSLRKDLNGNTRLPREKSEVAADIVPLMGLIKNLSQEIRQEVTQMKNN